MASASGDSGCGHLTVVMEDSNSGVVDNHEDRIMTEAAMYDGEASAEDSMGIEWKTGWVAVAVVDTADEDSMKRTMTMGDGNSDDERRRQQRRTVATTMTRRQQQRARPWKGRHNVDAAGKGGNER